MEVFWLQLETLTIMTVWSSFVHLWPGFVFQKSETVFWLDVKFCTYIPFYRHVTCRWTTGFLNVDLNFLYLGKQKHAHVFNAPQYIVEIVIKVSRHSKNPKWKKYKIRLEKYLIYFHINKLASMRIRFQEHGLKWERCSIPKNINKYNSMKLFVFFTRWQFFHRTT